MQKAGPHSFPNKALPIHPHKCDLDIGYSKETDLAILQRVNTVLGGTSSVENTELNFTYSHRMRTTIVQGVESEAA